jgi:hypothetical protein
MATLVASRPALANSPPTLSPIANITLDEDAGTQTVALSGIGPGAGDENQTLTITALSSNPSLIPNPTITYTNPSANGSLTLRPEVKTVGTAVITVIVDDGQPSDNMVVRSFLVTVAVNDLPTISPIADRTINENTSTGPIPFTVSDSETAASALVVAGNSSNPTLVPPANLVFAGSGTNRTVTVIPASHQFGTATIILTATDSAGGTGSRAFSVTVNAVASPLQSGVYQTLPGATVEEHTDRFPAGSRVVPLSATLTFDLSSAPPSLTAVIPNAVLEGGEPFALTVHSSSGLRLNDGTYRFTGDYLREIDPAATQYLFDWSFSTSTDGQVVWNGTTFWAGGHIWFVTISNITMTAVVSPPVERATSGVYEIVSGTYTECCGFAGDVGFSLPNERQRFVRLTVDARRDLATMTFLGQDLRTVFSVVPCPAGSSIPFHFDYGFIFSNSIIFHVDPGPPPYSVYWSYSVSNSANRLRIDGTLGTAHQNCVDVPTRFSHSNVVAVLVPPPRLSITGVSNGGARLFLQGRAGRTNVIEASTDLITWVGVSTNVMDYSLCPICPFAIFEDSASTNLARRFYRAFEIP